MKYYALPNLNWQDVELLQLHPSEIENKRPPFDGGGNAEQAKKDFREWSNSQATKHVFFSPFEAYTPSLRVTVDNPALYMHGWVLDYDASVSPDMVDLIQNNGAKGLLPMWICTTFSGHKRLIFEFEQPVMVDHKELADRFLKQLGKVLQVDNLLPALDPKSFTTTQYFELGKQWERIPNSNPIPESILMAALFQAAKQKIISGEGPDIPIEKVEEEATKRWPGRVKSLKVGDRTPLFWIDPFIDRVGAQVGDHGMICYSSRAGRGFVPWSDILGKEFVRDFQARKISDATKDIYFDSKSYWARLNNGEWATNNKEDMGADLVVRYGLNQKGGEIMEALSVVRNSRRVTGAFPFIHNKQILIHSDSGTFLNITTRPLVQPAEDEGNFPWIKKWLDNSFANVDGQREAFISWLHHFYKSAYEGNLRSGHAIFIAGDVNRGKTLIARQLIGAAMGGATDAADFLLGKTTFNKEAAECAVWCVDDNRGGSTWEKHDEFSNAIKRFVANPAVPYHPKYKDSFMVPWRGRIIVTCNTDEKSLSILPELDDSVRDKIMLFRLNDNFLPDFSMPEGIEVVLKRETPFFLKWLLAWETPAEWVGDPRFGVKSFLHKDLVLASYDASPSGQLVEMMTIALKTSVVREKGETERWMTSTDIRRILDCEGLRTSLQKFAGNRLGIALSQLPIGKGELVLATRREKHANVKQFKINLAYNPFAA